ncbi:hypothetical protein DFH11DRAFT_17035 [Phellopilus nigrolimitatus]|nr:hypothetical protein DFH11DRAFT_17035 [Phellopilus nigrolimitatus]
MPIHTKHGDMVEWDYSEEEANFENVEWFKDPPPRQAETQHSSPASVSDPYVPAASVVEENERFIYALKHAPNVLYSRFKQYGQLGVLGWCSEFSELIDSLKSLGFNGNMFVATRDQALKTCADILRLKLDVRMQIIIMYLSSQVARLRRFLDGEASFDDYPETGFPR